MKHIFHSLTLIFLLTVGFGARCQDTSFTKIVRTEIDLNYKFPAMFSFSNDAQRDSMNHMILVELGRVLEDPMSYYYPFDSLPWIGKIYSPDLKFRIITWNVPAMDGTHTYYGFIQYPQKKGKSCLVFRLHDRSKEIKTPENQALTADHWWGALYYEIIMNKNKGKRVYTLIGYDLNDRYSNKKVIDVLTYNDNNAPDFGRPVFQVDGKIKYRVIFEYAEDVMMTIRYSPEIKMIVFDHLSPIEPAFRNNPRYYAPDSSYDGFRFNKGTWEYIADIDARNP